jgi:hypothetical protein
MILGQPPPSSSLFVVCTFESFLFSWAESAWDIPFPYFITRFLNQNFFVINFSYFVIRFLLDSFIVKSDNQIGKVNDQKNMIEKSDNEIGKF